MNPSIATFEAPLPRITLERRLNLRPARRDLESESGSETFLITRGDTLRNVLLASLQNVAGNEPDHHVFPSAPPGSSRLQLPGPPQTCRATIIFFTSAIALAGFSPFGQALAQFMIVWQR